MRDQVFISYSHRDAAWLERLQVYLAPFERRGQLRRWDDTLIAPGERWAQEINEALGRARVAVLLVSAQFLASDFIARVELPRLLGAAEDQGVAILPLVIDWCNFERIPELAQFQSLNPPSQPLETMSESDAKAVLARLAAAVADTLQDGDVVGCERGRLVGLPARNPLFTGRDALLATLGEQLAGGGARCTVRYCRHRQDRGGDRVRASLPQPPCVGAVVAGRIDTAAAARVLCHRCRVRLAGGAWQRPACHGASCPPRA